MRKKQQLTYAEFLKCTVGLNKSTTESTWNKMFSKYGKKEFFWKVLQFQNKFDTDLRVVYKKLMKLDDPCFSGLGGDDGWRDFKWWIVLSGKKKRFLRNPNLEGCQLVKEYLKQGSPEFYSIHLFLDDMDYDDFIKQHFYQAQNAKGRWTWKKRKKNEVLCNWILKRNSNTQKHSNKMKLWTLNQAKSRTRAPIAKIHNITEGGPYKDTRLRILFKDGTVQNIPISWCEPAKHIQRHFKTRSKKKKVLSFLENQIQCNWATKRKKRKKTSLMTPTELEKMKSEKQVPVAKIIKNVTDSRMTVMFLDGVRQDIPISWCAPL